MQQNPNIVTLYGRQVDLTEVICLTEKNQPLNAIKLLRTLTDGAMSLHEAKDYVDNLAQGNSISNTIVFEKSEKIEEKTLYTTKTSNNKASRGYDKIYYLISGFIYFICLGIGIYLCITPMAVIGDSVNMGSSFYLIKECIVKEYESSLYISGTLYTFAFINILICLVLLITSLGDFFNKRIQLEQIIPSLIFNILFFVLSEIVAYLALNPVCKYYLCTTQTSFLLLMLLFLPRIIMNTITLIHKRQEIKEIIKARRKHRIKNKIMPKVIFTSIPLVLLTTIIVLVFSFYPQPLNLFILPNSNCDIDHLIEKFELNVGRRFSVVGDAPTNVVSHTYIVSKDKDLKIEISPEINSWKEYGNNYLYYKTKTKELKEEIFALKSDSWDKYLEQFAEMEAGVSFLSKEINNLPYNYAIIEFGPLEEELIYTGGDFHLGLDKRWEFHKELLSYTHNRNANYCDENGKKWGYSDGSLGSVILGEKIELSQNFFSNDTDFSTERIIATVSYSDGSRKISFITPTNAKELNTASAGRHLLRWSDEWGDYETYITINND